MSDEQTQKQRVIAVGGGYASVKFALELSKNDAFDVTLISPHDELEYHGALYRSATGHSPLEVVVPFREIFAESSAYVINDFLTEVRAEVKEIKCQSGRTYPYDILVLGLGYEIDYYGIRGMREHAESMYTMYDTIKLRNTLRDTMVNKAGQDMNVVMIGAGPTGIEAASDLGFFARIVGERYNKEPAHVHVSILDKAKRVLPTLSQEVSELAHKRLEELSVRTRLGVEVDHCTAHDVFLSSGEKISADCIIWSAGSRANSFFERYPSLFELDHKKRVVVNEYLQSKDENIYILGDAAATKYAGMAQTAISDGVFLANNLIRTLNGSDRETYIPQTPIYVVPIGLGWAIAEVDGCIKTGAEGWKVRRDADMFVLSNYLHEELAKKHWGAAFLIAKI